MERRIESAPQRRKHERHVVEVQVECFIQDENVRLAIYDICVDGCCIDTGHARVAPGERVYLKFLSGVSAEGTVIWKSDQYAGVRFASELHPAVILQMGFKPVAVSMDDYAPRDRFGRELPPIQGFQRAIRNRNRKEWSDGRRQSPFEGRPTGSRSAKRQRGDV